MLTELHVHNLGVIEHAHVLLGSGLTAVTGETGAGKTMLVEALELLVGGRADSTVVRHGAPEARVDGRFVTGDDELVLSRVVPAHGRSRAYVDGRPAPVSTLAEIAADLVELHGQHAHQQLLSAPAQRRGLDEFAGVDLGPWVATRDEIAAIDRELGSLGGDARSRAREADLLRYQIDEIGQARLDDPEEDAHLATEESVLADAVGHQEAGARAMSRLDGDAGARDALGHAIADLGDRIPFAAAARRLSGLLAELDDVISDVRHTADTIEDDPERRHAVMERRQLLRNLRRKYGDRLADVMAEADRLRGRLRELERHDATVEALHATRHDAVSRRRALGAHVGAARRRAAPVLAAAVTGQLDALGLGHAELVVDTGDPGTDPAADTTRFLFTASPPNPALPLAKVASGGELARTMLALRLSLIAGSTTDRVASPTLVFDEVDAGIGGTAAIAVGQALARLGRTDQVLVVTHLAQVAAQADAQIVVDKQVEDSSTVARVSMLDADRRVDEIARMLAGHASSDSARRHATELLGG